MSTTSKRLPSSVSSKVMPFIRIRSMTPWCCSSTPHGIWMGTAFALSFSLMLRTDMSKSAPRRSILLMKQMRGTP
jgi:hypothetical protein